MTAILGGKKVTIVIPVYNESLAVKEILDRVLKASILGAQKEVVVVDDGSVDPTVQLIHEYISEHPQHKNTVKIHRSYINHGKGAALRAGFELATGDILIIQDGDLEYSPNDYEKILAPFADPKVTIVYGNRFANGYPSGMQLPNLVANRILAWTASLLYGQTINDEATGYKVFRRSVLDSFSLKCRGFEFCPEFTSKALVTGHHIIEVPISYNARGVFEGKKIKARDGFIAMWWLVKQRFQAKPKAQKTLAAPQKVKEFGNPASPSL